MKKSLIAAAVAGLFAAPAFAATSNVDVYGVMNIAIQSVDDTATSGEIDVVDNVSRIGFKGSEDLGGGLKAIWQIENQMDSQGANSATDNKTGALGSGSLRNTFVGLAGNFGTVVLGRHDTPYKIATGKYDTFADTVADYNGKSLDQVQLINATHDARASGALAYISPSFSGLTIAAAVVMDAVHLDASSDGDQDLDAYSLAAMYANGPLTIDAAYQDVDGYSSAWKIGAGYTFGDLTVGAVYENSDDAQEQEGWMVTGKYVMGPIVLKATYGAGEAGSSGVDYDMWAVGADYNLSKRTTAYIIYGNGDNGNDSTTGAGGNGGDVGGWNIGVKHSF